MPYGREGVFVTHGPPGTGKTSRVARWVSQLCSDAPTDDLEDGRSPVIVCSLTKAAAAEAAGRKMPIPRDAVGTLHSLGFRSTGCPPVVTAGLVVADWNERPAVRAGGRELDPRLFAADPA